MRMRTDECPIDRFDKDLLAQIDALLLEGYQIILMGDLILILWQIVSWTKNNWIEAS